MGGGCSVCLVFSFGGGGFCVCVFVLFVWVFCGFVLFFERCLKSLGMEFHMTLVGQCKEELSGMCL